MRIGLVRHFKVQEPIPSGWVTSAHLVKWREAYEIADVEVAEVDLRGYEWPQCWASDAPRAQTTAKAAYSGPITTFHELREAEVLPFQTGNVPLPFPVWHLLLRLSLATGHSSQRSARDSFINRIREMTDKLVAQTMDTLVVSHAGVMYFMRKELLRRGFKGPKFKVAKHGHLYVFEK